MKHTKCLPKYTVEIIKQAENHNEALLALYVDAFNDGMKIGTCNALFGASLAIVVGAIGLCIAGITYLERKEQP